MIKQGKPTTDNNSSAVMVILNVKREWHTLLDTVETPYLKCPIATCKCGDYTTCGLEGVNNYRTRDFLRCKREMVRTGAASVGPAHKVL